MKIVVLIEEPDKLDEYTEADMRRWWRHSVVKHSNDGEVFFEVDGMFNVRGGVKRLASFGVKARAARRAVPNNR